MTSRSRRSNRRKGRYGLTGRGEDVNPMNSLSNLSDAMLVLAMGIMVALVLHWNVNLAEAGGSMETEDPNQIVMFGSDDLENRVELPKGAVSSGELYYDAQSDTYYVVNNK